MISIIFFYHFLIIFIMVYVNHLSRNGLNYHLQSQHTAARCVLNKRNVPFCSQNAFITLNADGLIAVMRQTTRSLQFWRRVLTIWASFKFTQANVTLQAQFRNADWQRRTWDRQHHRAADVRSVCLRSFTFFKSLYYDTELNNMY